MERPTTIWMARIQPVRPYRREWVALHVVSETSRSWLAQENTWHTHKVPKKKHDADVFAFTEEEKAAADARYADRLWVHKHRHRIGDWVSYKGEVTVEGLRQIADIVGYVEPEA